ncbi:hypothetical protein [Clostridium polynesiense]|uniref:hypothetical protein n=1 Tax=Clostridium polynesiense TaxID=1325933 RepID=UPI000693CFE9|nr:hypothetical protein [Clostridium polynesiense]
MSERIEKIMENYSQIVMECKCIENQINSFKGITEDDAIEFMYFSQPDSERIQTNAISNKTATIAITYKEKREQINREWMEHLCKRYSVLSEQLLFFQSAVLSLSGILPDFIKDMVIASVTWDSLAEKYHISRTMVAKNRKKAIKELEILYSLYDKELEEYILS